MSAKKAAVSPTEPSKTTARTTTPLNVPEPIPSKALPKGFRFAAAACGLRRKNRLDLGVVIADKPCTAAGMFTRNLVKAAPVLLCQEHIGKAASRIRAIVVNSGNANCANGPAGMRASRATAKTAARALRCRDEQILVCSTGVIGLPLPVEKIVAALPELSRTAAGAAANYDGFTHSIMTTDTRPKWAAASCRIGGKTVRLLGCAKGAGMIHPNLATMLAFLLTDAVASQRVLNKALAEVAERRFNSITVAGATSANDTLLLLSSGESKAWGAPAITAGGRGYKAFMAALEKVCKKLALAIVSDGEGAGRVVEIEVRGAPNDAAAKTVAQTIATSPLVKTALAGGDPNWGRILAAAGRAGVNFRPERAAIRMAGLRVYDHGRALPFDEGAAHEKLLSTQVPIVMDLRAGRGRARVWTCDFTAEYVHINASYRT
jgi:glutamate N-acetyltransferase/amino-acid N-acetyltransferase